MPELIELTDEELVLVAGGVSLSGAGAVNFSGGIGTSVLAASGSSPVDGTPLSSTLATSGGAVAATALGSFLLQAAPPGS